MLPTFTRSHQLVFLQIVVDGEFEGLTLRGSDLGAIANPPPVRTRLQRSSRRALCPTLPLHPDYTEESKRAQSFNGKTPPQGQNISVLANAGFFYLGQHSAVTVIYHLLKHSDFDRLLHDAQYVWLVVLVWTVKVNSIYVIKLPYVNNVQ